jgi:lysophospholipase L1-like esterase
VLIAALVVAVAPRTAHAATVVGPKQYYLALGDSLAFGYQPNWDFSHGYPQQWYSSDLQARGESMTNYGCSGETSSTMVNGGCPVGIALHNYYVGPQLAAAVNFINAHKGQVSPVSLDIGANDILPDINSSTCVISSTWSTDLAKADTNLTTYILPQLTSAMKNSSGAMTGDLVMMNYYDPYQNKCPNSVSYVQQANQHLAADAAQFGVPIVDVFTAYGGATTPNPNTCNWTWECSSYADIHATTAGYGVIANTFKQGIGY